MTVTRSEVIKRLAEKSGYWQKAIDELLKAYDELLLEIMDGVTDDEEVVMQAFKGIKIGCSVVPERNRVDPRNREPILVKATVKPFVKWSEDFRKNIQEQYENKKSEDS